MSSFSSSTSSSRSLSSSSTGRSGKGKIKGKGKMAARRVAPSDGGEEGYGGSESSPKTKAQQREEILEDAEELDERAERVRKVITVGIIVLILAGFLVWLVLFIDNYRSDKESPGTVVSVDTESQVALPTVTLCDMNDQAFNPVAASLFVGRGLAPIDKTADFVVETEIQAEYGAVCISINKAGTAGTPYVLAGASSEYSLDLVLVSNTSRKAEDVYSYGTLVAFTPYGEAISPTTAEEASTYASPGRSTEIILQRTIFETIDNKQSVRYESVQSSVLFAEDNPNLVALTSLGLGVSFITVRFKAPLVTVKTKEEYSLPLTSAMAEVAGMIGTLLGVDLLGCMLFLQLQALRLTNKRRRETQRRLDAVGGGRDQPMEVV